MSDDSIQQSGMPGPSVGYVCSKWQAISGHTKSGFDPELCTQQNWLFEGITEVCYGKPAQYYHAQ